MLDGFLDIRLPPLRRPLAFPTSWKRVKGDGAKRTLTGYAPGTWWVRACSVRGADESDFTPAVAVVVK